MQILLNKLSVHPTNYGIDIKFELAGSLSPESLSYHLQHINREVFADNVTEKLILNQDVAVIHTFLSHKNKKGTWALKQLDSNTFKLTYHNTEVVALRTEQQVMSAKQCFAANKQRLYSEALFDLMHVFNCSDIKQYCNPCDADCSELRFDFSTKPISIELPDPTTSKKPHEVNEVVTNLQSLSRQLVREIGVSGLDVHALDAARVTALLPTTPFYSEEMITALKKIFSETEGILMGYLENGRTKSVAYYSCLNTLSEMRTLLKHVIVQCVQNKIAEDTKQYADFRHRANEFLATKQNNPIMIKAEGFPLTDQAWPRDRDLTNIEKLHTAQSATALSANHLNPATSFVESIASDVVDPIIVDIGAGLGHGLDDLRQILENKNIKPRCIAVGVTPLKPEYEKNMHAVFYTPVPDCQSLLEKLEGSVDFVMETYGASTYATHPLKALAYVTKLLRPGGTYKGIVSGVQRLPDGTPTGFVLTRAAIEAFFKEFGINVAIDETMIRSQVEGFENTTMADYLISFKKPSVNVLSTKGEKSFAELCAFIDTKFGQPVKYEHRDAFGKFSKFAIQANVYNGDTSQMLTRDLHKFGLKSYSLESAYTEGGPQLRYAFTFESPSKARIFVQKIKEQYRHRGYFDWLACINDRDSSQALLSFCQREERIAYYQKTLQHKIPHAQIVQSETADNALNKQKWLAMWTDANNQLCENYDIPQLQASLTIDTSFTIPNHEPPHCFHYLLGRSNHSLDLT